jgi:hypothetical protein
VLRCLPATFAPFAKEIAPCDVQMEQVRPRPGCVRGSGGNPGQWLPLAIRWAVAACRFSRQLGQIPSAGCCTRGPMGCDRPASGPSLLHAVEQAQGAVLQIPPPRHPPSQWMGCRPATISFRVAADSVGSRDTHGLAPTALRLHRVNAPWNPPGSTDTPTVFRQASQMHLRACE